MTSHVSGMGTGLTAQEIAAVRAPLSRAALLPSKIYSDPEIFRLERERIFGHSWIPVCHISQLVEPGSYVARNLAGEAVVAIRGREGDIGVFSNVCRHRNTVLTRGAGTCTGNRIVCPYHGWTYGLDGKLLAAPFMDQAEGFVRKDIRLPEFRHEIWHGFLFVTFDRDAPSLSEQLVGIEPEIAPYRFEDKVAIEMRRTAVQWNWKISLENFSEAYHQPWVHPATAEDGFPAALAIYKDATGPYSIFSLPQAKGEIVKTMYPPAPGMPDHLLRSATIFNVYPYLHALVDPVTALVLDFNIKNESEHELVWTVLMPNDGRPKSAQEEDVKRFAGFLAPILAEDVGVCTGVAQGVQSRFTAQGRLSHMEKPIHQFHNWWLDKMLAGDAMRAAAE